MTIVLGKSFEGCLYSWTCIHIISAEAESSLWFWLLLRNLASSSSIHITLTLSLLLIYIKCILLLNFRTVFCFDNLVDLGNVSFVNNIVPFAMILALNATATIGFGVASIFDCGFMKSVSEVRRQLTLFVSLPFLQSLSEAVQESYTFHSALFPVQFVSNSMQKFRYIGTCHIYNSLLLRIN